MRPRDDSALLKRAADDIRSLAELEPEIADELKEVAHDLDTEAERQIEAALRRQDFALSTRSLSARLAMR